MRAGRRRPPSSPAASTARSGPGRPSSPSPPPCHMRARRLLAGADETAQLLEELEQETRRDAGECAADEAADEPGECAGMLGVVDRADEAVVHRSIRLRLGDPVLAREPVEGALV